MRDAEALFLVDDDQSQVGKRHVALQESVRADDDVDVARGQPGQHVQLLAPAAEPAEQLNLDGMVGEARDEGVEVLLRKNGGGHQHRHLPPVHGGFECRPQGHLGLPIPHVAGDQTVHGALALHVSLGIGDGAELVGCLDECKGFLELALGRGVRTERHARGELARGVDLEQLRRYRLRRLLSAPLGTLPVGGIEAAEIRLRVAHADELLHSRYLIDWHVEAVVTLIFQEQILTRATRILELDDAGKARHAMVDMHHEVTGLEVREKRSLGSVPRAATAP